MKFRIVKIGSRSVGKDTCYVVAESGVNHNGDTRMAFDMVESAAQAGVDAVKFQVFRTEELVSPTAPKAAYQVRTTGTTESQWQMLKSLELPPSCWRDLSVACREREVGFLATPFDRFSADVLAELDVAAFKISSGDLTHLPLIGHVARFGKPVILSTGLATIDEIAEAVEVVRDCGAPLVLLHCVTAYPASPEECNLKAIAILRDTFGVPTGFSDHTAGVGTAPLAVAAGACMVEKHFTLDRRLPGPDHTASIDTAGLKELVSEIRRVERIMGNGEKRPVSSERENMAAARRSLVAAREMPAGTCLRESDLAARRPGTGIPPAHMNKVVGRKLKTSIGAGEAVTWEALQ